MQRYSKTWQATLIAFLGLCGLAHADLKDDWQHLYERQSFWASRNRNVGVLRRLHDASLCHRTPFKSPFDPNCLLHQGNLC